jgi:hypothetical protein
LCTFQLCLAFSHLHSPFALCTATQTHTQVGFRPQEHIDFKIQNIVGTVDVGFPIRLEGLVYAHSTFASYEPELFPGLIYRLVSPRVVFLIFVSGKIVMTGARTERDLTEAFCKLHPVLIEYRKTSVAPPLGSNLAQLATTAAGGGASASPSTSTGTTTPSKTTKTRKRRKKSDVGDVPMEQV